MLQKVEMMASFPREGLYQNWNVIQHDISLLEKPHTLQTSAL